MSDRVDGRGTILDMRWTEVEENGGEVLRKRICNAVVLEKKNYIFRNERHMAVRVYCFQGCNFPILFIRRLPGN